MITEFPAEQLIELGHDLCQLNFVLVLHPARGHAWDVEFFLSPLQGITIVALLGLAVGEACMLVQGLKAKEVTIAEGKRPGELNSNRKGFCSQGHPMYLISCCVRCR